MTDLHFVDILRTEAPIQEKVRMWRNSDNIRPWMLNRDIITPEEHARWLTGLRDSTDARFWVVFCGNTPIGSVYLQKIDPADKTSEWGFYIAEEDYKGKGISKQMLYRLLELYFDEMCFDKLFTKVLSQNTVAVNLYRKFQFKEKQRVLSEDGRELILFEVARPWWLKKGKEEISGKVLVDRS